MRSHSFLKGDYVLEMKLMGLGENTDAQVDIISHINKHSKSVHFTLNQTVSLFLAQQF